MRNSISGDGEGNPPSAQDAAANPLHVKLAVYDGPLDLLLELIKKNEMNIYDIPVAEITKQYLETLATMKQLDLEIAGEFIVMAAALIYIKSKMLLPVEREEEDEEGGDPRAELVRKLLEYQAFKEAAKGLGVLEGERGKIFTRQIADYYLSDLEPGDAGIDTFSANLYDLLSAFQSVVARLGPAAAHEVFEPILSLEEKMAEIKRLLLEKGKVFFSELFTPSPLSHHLKVVGLSSPPQGGEGRPPEGRASPVGGVRGWSRQLLIVTFLATLELVRTRFARVAQKDAFGEIAIEKV